MKALIVLDYIEERVDVYPYDETIWESPEDFTDDDGNYILHSNCNWMVVENVNIKVHKNVQIKI